MKVAFFLVLSSCQTFECDTCCIVTSLELKEIIAELHGKWEPENETLMVTTLEVKH